MGRRSAAETGAPRDGRGRELSSELAAERNLLRVRHWAFVIMGGIAIGLLPWTVYLSITLPPKHESVHWDIVWPGLCAIIVRHPERLHELVSGRHKAIPA